MSSSSSLRSTRALPRWGTTPRSRATAGCSARDRPRSTATSTSPPSRPTSASAATAPSSARAAGPARTGRTSWTACKPRPNTSPIPNLPVASAHFRRSCAAGTPPPAGCRGIPCGCPCLIPSPYKGRGLRALARGEGTAGAGKGRHSIRGAPIELRNPDPLLCIVSIPANLPPPH